MTEELKEKITELMIDLIRLDADFIMIIKEDDDDKYLQLNGDTTQLLREAADTAPPLQIAIDNYYM